MEQNHTDRTHTVTDSRTKLHDTFGWTVPTEPYPTEPPHAYYRPPYIGAFPSSEANDD